jgi:thiol-disulfide isomerase/thioredoxin
MRKSLLALAALALIVTPAFAGQFNKKVSVGQKAPTFAGIPAVIGDQEASLTLSDIKEDVVVLAFSGNHCPVVQAYEDRMIDFVNAYKGKSVKFICVSVNDLDSDRLPAIKTYTKEKGSNYVYGFDESQQIGRDYGATNTPQFFVFDKDRVIRYMGALDDNMKESAVTKTYLKDAVDALLAGQEIKVTETQPKGCGVKYKAR